MSALTAHRLLHLAGCEHGAGAQRALAQELFAAHFTRGASIADHALLAELAASAGMDAARARSYLDTDEGLAETWSEVEQAQRLGIRAVPTFVFDGRRAVQGAQPPPVFLQALKQAAAESRAAPAGGGAGQTCTNRGGAP